MFPGTVKYLLHTWAYVYAGVSSYNLFVVLQQMEGITKLHIRYGMNYNIV